MPGYSPRRSAAAITARRAPTDTPPSGRADLEAIARWCADIACALEEDYRAKTRNARARSTNASSSKSSKRLQKTWAWRICRCGFCSEGAGEPGSHLLQEKFCGRSADIVEDIVCPLLPSHGTVTTPKPQNVTGTMKINSCSRAPQKRAQIPRSSPETCGTQGILQRILANTQKTPYSIYPSARRSEKPNGMIQIEYAMRL